MRSVWRALWLSTGAVAVLAAAQWLRTPSVPYLVASIVATAVTLGVGLRFSAHRRWAIGFVATMTAFVVAAAIAQSSIGRIDREWDAYRADIEFGAADRLENALRSTASNLGDAAAAALLAPAELDGAFAALSRIVRRGDGERGLVLYRNGQPIAWAGMSRINADTLTARLGTTFTPFYLTLYATATRGDLRAVATALVHADPPADRLAKRLDAAVARAAGVRGYEYEPADGAASGFTMFASRTDTLFGARPSPITPSEARLRAVEKLPAIVGGAA